MRAARRSLPLLLRCSRCPRSPSLPCRSPPSPLSRPLHRDKQEAAGCACAERVDAVIRHARQVLEHHPTEARSLALGILEQRREVERVVVVECQEVARHCKHCPPV
eukprot:907335-Pleurochrysis_carterae.AAC.3